MIYIIRHGQTDWNKIGRIQGHIDIDLNNQGKEQASVVKEKLKNIKFDKVFCSPLKRALQTAQTIYDGEIIVDERLIERYNGELEGKLNSEIKVFPDFNDPNDTSYGIEPLTSFRTRVKDFFEEISTKYKNKNISIKNDFYVK